ncbi:hypothetical protein JXB41_02055 [Candidatus Woesearchaeota archaeon]|nr:hypothetical protein [Candidatus Woesearchaeota archaeon]
MNGHNFFFRPNFWIELIYSIVIIVASLFIFFRTRRMYKLTEHKGIKYFSYTFLFFAMTHVLRFFFRIFFRIFVVSSGFFRPQMPPFRIGDFFFVYSSILAGLYLFYSLMWKKIKLNDFVLFVISSMFSILIIVLDFILRIPLLHIISLIIIFSVMAIVSLKGVKKSWKKHPFFIIYILIFFVWIINIISSEIPMFLIELKLILFLISAGLYLSILLRIIRKTKIKK